MVCSGSQQPGVTAAAAKNQAKLLCLLEPESAELEGCSGGMSDVLWWCGVYFSMCEVKILQ